MKNNVKFIVGILLVTLCSKSFAQDSNSLKTPEDFAKTIFLSLQSADIKLYETTSPSILEFKKFLLDLKSSINYNEEFEREKKNYRLERFQNIISYVKKNNLDLNNSSFCGFEGKIDTINNGILIKKGYICFETKFKTYKIEAESICFINDKWLSLEELHLSKDSVEKPTNEKITETQNTTTKDSSTTDAELAKFLAGPQIEIESSGINVSPDKFSKGKPFKTTINTVSDKRYYTQNELNEASKPINIIGKPIKIGNLLIAENDFPEKFNWNSAKIACSNLGSGWRLPTKEELNILYQNKNKIGNFSKYGYWSSTESSTNGVAWFQDFYLGGTKPMIANKLSLWGVRAVKTSN